MKAKTKTKTYAKLNDICWKYKRFLFFFLNTVLILNLSAKLYLLFTCQWMLNKINGILRTQHFQRASWINCDRYFKLRRFK